MRFLIAVLFASGLCAQQFVPWSATTGDVSQTGSSYTATMQQPATNAFTQYIDSVSIYCSAACNVTQTANGTAASATAGTVIPSLPAQLNALLTINFFTASNVGSGTLQGGVIHIPAGVTVSVCLSTICLASHQTILGSAGTGNNYSVVIAGYTGTSNITFYGRQAQ